jgi:hypothetical protein
LGVPQEQAEVQAQAIGELVYNRLVTKEYLDLRLAEMKRDIDARFASVEIRIAATKAELVKWMFGVATGQLMLLVAIVRLLA